MKTTHRTSAEKIIWTQVCLFCFLFCCCFSIFFLGGGGQGVGVRFVLFCFLWGGGARIQRNATLMQSIALRSAIVGREIWSQVVCLFRFFVCLFFWFLFYFYYFFGGGGWLSFFGGGGQGMDYPNYAPSTVSQKILAQFRFRFVLLFVVV